MQNSGTQKIGVFDSGLGGLTILKALREVEPELDYLYLGDSARAPYGPRDFDTILEYSLEAVETLFQMECQIVILACNTASAKALRTIQQRYLPKHHGGKRVLGVIRPSVEYLAAKSKTGTVGIWATEGTVLSDSYKIELEHYAPQIKVIQQACPLLVPHIETGPGELGDIDRAIESYWKSTLRQSDNLDTLLLGCTHYPILFEEIQKALPAKIHLIHQGMILGPSWKDYLSRHYEQRLRLSQNGSCHFLVTANAERFSKLGGRLLGFQPQCQNFRLNPKIVKPY